MRSVSIVDVPLESDFVEDDIVLPMKQTDGITPVNRDEDVEDDAATVSTDDPVGLAMEATLGEHDDDEDEMEDERILYPQRTSTSPPMCVCPFNLIFFHLRDLHLPGLFLRQLRRSHPPYQQLAHLREPPSLGLQQKTS